MHFDYKELNKEVNRTYEGKKLSDVDLANVGKDPSGKIAKDKSDKVDFCLLMDNLDELEKMCNTDKRKPFFSFFQDAIVGAYYRYRKSKKEAWSWKKYLCWLICSAVLPIISAIIVQALVDGSGVLVEVSTVLTFVIIFTWIFAVVYTEWVKNKKAKETWVRHSVCFGRLNLALSHFVLSARSEADYNEFVSATFSILEQNLDQFALNLSSNGLAERVISGSEKERNDE